MKPLLATLSVAVILSLVATSAAWAKGAVDRITISGPGLEGSVDITETESLAQFSPWMGGFLGPKTSANEIHVETLIGPYEVRFLLRNQQGRTETIYGFSYYLTEGAESGFIALPGSDDQLLAINNATIIRPQGSWYVATDDWNQLVSEQLERPESDPEEGQGSFAEQIPTALLVAVVVVVVVAWLTVRTHYPPRR